MKWKIIAGGAAALLLIPIAYVLARALAPLAAAHAGLLGALALAVVLLVSLGGLRILFAYGRLASARAKTAEIVSMQNGQPLHVGDVSRLAGRLLPHGLDRYYDVEERRAAVPPQLTHWHYEAHPALPSGGTLADVGSVVLPATPQLVSDSDWRSWMDRAPHLLIAGRTEAGKTTLATALLAERALSGDQVLVLDPHHQPGKWAGMPTIGGGNDFEAILSRLPLLIREMKARYEEFERGKLTEEFQRLTVLIDEVPAIVDATMETTPSGRPRIVDPRWMKFAKRLGSEARKVRISVILMTQSTLVQDILINQQQRENYLRVALGDRARGLLHEEPRAQRRQALDDLLRGQPYPAAMEWKGDFYLLDTSAVPQLAQRPIGPVAAWIPPPLPQQQLSAAPAQAAPTQARTVPPTVELPPPTVKDQIVMLLEARAGQWLTHSEIARALGVDVGVIQTEAKELFDNRVIERRTTRRGNERLEYSTNQSTNAQITHRFAPTA